ncbi:MAG: hypothetical protein R2780_02145 [Crocinitomicaceae bacterium]|nr:hypothetical protein [Crocinitomicaceae bacterium]
MIGIRNYITLFLSIWTLNSIAQDVNIDQPILDLPELEQKKLEVESWQCNFPVSSGEMVIRTASEYKHLIAFILQKENGNSKNPEKTSADFEEINFHNESLIIKTFYGQGCTNEYNISVREDDINEQVIIYTTILQIGGCRRPTIPEYYWCVCPKIDPGYTVKFENRAVFTDLTKDLTVPKRINKVANNFIEEQFGSKVYQTWIRRTLHPTGKSGDSYILRYELRPPMNINTNLSYNTEIELFIDLSGEITNRDKYVYKGKDLTTTFLSYSSACKKVKAKVDEEVLSGYLNYQKGIFIYNLRTAKGNYRLDAQTGEFLN